MPGSSCSTLCVQSCIWKRWVLISAVKKFITECFVEEAYQWHQAFRLDLCTIYNNNCVLIMCVCVCVYKATWLVRSTNTARNNPEKHIKDGLFLFIFASIPETLGKDSCRKCFTLSAVTAVEMFALSGRCSFPVSTLNLFLPTYTIILSWILLSCLWCIVAYSYLICLRCLPIQPWSPPSRVLGPHKGLAKKRYFL